MAESRLNAALRAGIRAAQNNDTERARELLEGVLRRDRNNEIAWIWLAAVVSSSKEKQVCLKNILRINEDNDAARDALTNLTSIISDSSSRQINTGALMRDASQELPDAPDTPRASGGGDGTILGMDYTTARLVLIGVAVVLVLGLVASLLLLNGGDAPEPTPTVVVRAEATAESTAEVTIDPNAPTLTPAPTEPTPTSRGIVITRDVTAVVNTATPTPTPTITPTPTATLPPVESYPLYFVATNRDGTNQSLYQADANNAAEPEALVPNARDVAIDPLGQRIAYAQLVSGSDGTAAFELFVGTVSDPQNAQQVTSFGSGEASSPSFSPDGSQVVYAANVDGDNEIYIYNSATGEQNQLTQNDANDRDPHWSLDGTRIVYSSDVNSPGRGDLYVLNFADGDPLQAERSLLLDTNNNSYAPRFSPDGSQVALVTDTRSGSEVQVSRVDVASIRTISDSVSVNVAPVWSPEGRYLFYLSDNNDEEILQIVYSTLNVPATTGRVFTPGRVVQSLAIRP